MKQISQCAPMRRFCECLQKLTRYHIAATSEMTLSLYADEVAAEPEQSHTMRCSLRQNLWRMIALAGAIALLLALARKILSWLSPS